MRNFKQTSQTWLAVIAALCLSAIAAQAQTIAWQENWESPMAQDNWYADLGYWEIGVPTYGPPVRGDGFRAHQGTNVAATVLNGNYTDNRQSRLISSPITIPATNQNPRLRFWHWWSFSTYDYGQVQISTNNGVSWIGISGQYSADSNGRWSRGWVDLSNYGGQTILLGLYFYSAQGAYASPNVSSGWYVDEMVIETGAPPLPPLNLPEGFETGWAGWTADFIGGKATDFGIWEIGVPTSGPGSAHSGTNCAATVLNTTYPDNRSSRLVSQPLSVPPAELNPRLRFWHWWSFSTYDYGQVQISTNNGASWINLSGQYGADSSGRWSRCLLDLSNYGGQTILLGLYFYSAQGAYASPNVSSGWYVDELVIESGVEPELSPSDSFESGWVSWKADYMGGNATDYAIWEIGVPTSGPGSAHGGTNCAATVLGGNYPDNRSARLVSPPFVVPAIELNPRLRFWHWWSFSTYDYGQIQITTNNGATWIAISTYNTSSAWTRPQLDLTPYAGQSARIGLYFQSDQGAYASPNVSSGWYVDEIRVLYDPAVSLIGSPIVRTQDTACVSLKIALDAPTPGASFLIEAPAGNFASPLFTPQGCWSGTVTQQSPTQWLVSLTSTCTNVPVVGPHTIGTICFTAISEHSAFVPLTVSSPVVTNWATAFGYGSRAVTIANEPLMESWLNASGKRMATTYGKANTSYEIRYSTNVNAPGQWAVGWSNTVPASLVIHSPVGGASSNAPVLYLKAREQ